MLYNDGRKNSELSCLYLRFVLYCSVIRVQALWNGSSYCIPTSDDKVLRIICWAGRTAWIVCIISDSMHCLSLVYWIKVTLHVSGGSTVHHQEVRCVYVANGTCKMTVSEPRFADSHLSSAVWLLYAQLRIIRYALQLTSLNDFTLYSSFCFKLNKIHEMENLNS
jgi:hypothetical protein